MQKSAAKKPIYSIIITITITIILTRRITSGLGSVGLSVESCQIIARRNAAVMS